MTSLLFLIIFIIICNVNCDKIFDQCLKNLNVWDTNIFPEYKKILTTNKRNESVRIILSTSSFPTKFSPTAYEYHASSLTMAYRSFCSNGGFVNKDQKIDIVFLNDRCNPDAGVPNMIEVNEAGGDAVFGMPCSTVTKVAGFFVKHYNIPLISYASNDDVLTDKDTYSTVIRFGIGYQMIGKAFIEIFRAFKWNTISIMVRDGGLCQYGGTILDQAVRKEEGITVVEFNQVALAPTDEELLRYLKNFKERSRVLVVCLSNADMVRFMELAHDQGMTSSEYVYLTFTIMPSQTTLQPWGSTTGLDKDTINKRKAAFKRVKTLSPADMIGPDKTVLLQEMADQMSQYPWYINSTKNLGIAASPFSLYLHDIMTFYLSAVNESLTEGRDPRNGTLVFKQAQNRIFEGVSGEVIINDNADRIPNYWLWQITPGDQEFTDFAGIRMISTPGQRVTIRKAAYWGTDDGLPPPNEPVCGYRYEKCPPSTKGRDAALIGGFSCFAVVIIIVFTGIIFYRRKRFEDDLHKMTWKIFYEDIEFSSRRMGGSSYLMMMSLKSVKSDISEHADKTGNSKSDGHDPEQIFTKIGSFKGVVCAIKQIQKTDCKLSRQDLIDLKFVKNINHENINSFIGASIEPPNIYILSNYCAKGSLQDILEQDEIKLDWTFKSSLIYDLISGLHFIHNSPLTSHGHLKSAGCLIDSRWVLKISNVGLNAITYTNAVKKDIGDYGMYRDELWTAPELLRLEPTQRPIKGTQSGDIYSLSIILQEILFRSLPYFMEDLSPKQIIQKVKTHLDPPFRPHIKSLDKDTDPKMVLLMQECWDENPDFRPDISRVRKNLAALNKGRKVNILDNMVQKLERYANNLEEIVEKRTEELVMEKQKTDLLLYRMLPSVVAEKLKNGQQLSAEIYDSVSIYFSDVVGFTSISSDSTPMQVVDLLNDLYTTFDDIIAKHDVYKVETIGDAYMCVSGCPNKNGNRHAAEIANMSLSLRENVKKFRIRHMPNRALRIRIGVHSGSCAAGVVGLTMPRYCLFGDTVNVASRMESNGEVMKIHISEETYKILGNMKEYDITCRGEVELKGKGTVTTYWLNSGNHSNTPELIHSVNN